MKRLIGLVVFGAVIIGWAVWRANKTEESVDTLNQTQLKAAEIIDRADGVEKYEDFLSEHLDLAERAAIDASYTPPRRRRPAEFDRELYVKKLGAALLARGKLHEQENRELHVFLTQLAIDLEKALREGEFDAASH